MPMIVSRTGYTGEDGFELYHDIQYSLRLWDALMAAGDVTPAGLGARDTLRLEMGMALYGNDIDDTVTPLEANLGWLTKLNKGEFVGRAALEKVAADGPAKRLVGPTQLSGSTATLYTVPGGTKAILRHIRMINTSNATVNSIKLSIGADAAGTRIIPDLSLSKGASYDWSGFMVMDAAELLKGQAGTASAITIIVSGIEIT